MALDASAAGALMAQAIEAQAARATPLGPVDMATELARIYRDYSREATLPGAHLSAGGDVSLLVDAFLVEDPQDGPERLAAGLCKYWATCGVPGVPAHGGTSVVSVTITTAGHLVAMRSAVQSLITDQAQAEPFRRFFQITEAVVRTFPCVVVEIIPGTPPVPTPFPEVLA